MRQGMDQKAAEHFAYRMQPIFERGYYPEVMPSAPDTPE